METKDGPRDGLIKAIRRFTVEAPSDAPNGATEEAIDELLAALDHIQPWAAQNGSMQRRVGAISEAGKKLVAALADDTKALREAAEAYFGGNFRAHGPPETDAKTRPSAEQFRDHALDVFCRYVDFSEVGPAELSAMKEALMASFESACRVKEEETSTIEQWHTVRVLTEALRRAVTHLGTKPSEDEEVERAARDDYHAARMLVGRTDGDWDDEAAGRGMASIRREALGVEDDREPVAVATDAPQ